MEHSVWSEVPDVRAALWKLGLTVEPLLDVVRAGYLARLTRTENDPSNAPGTYQWIEMVRTLREQRVADGWERSNMDGLPTVVHAARGIAIIVSSGDAATGLVHGNPTTKYHKGPGTVDRIESNAQLLLFPDEFPPFPTHDWDAIATWMLLVFTGEHEVRSELSLATKIEGGKMGGWKERIILPVLPTDGDDYQKNCEPDFGPDVDIEIRRRA